MATTTTTTTTTTMTAPTATTTRNGKSKSKPDPLSPRQTLAVAEALLERMQQLEADLSAFADRLEGEDSSDLRFALSDGEGAADEFFAVVGCALGNIAGGCRRTVTLERAAAAIAG